MKKRDLLGKSLGNILKGDGFLGFFLHLIIKKNWFALLQCNIGLGVFEPTDFKCLLCLGNITRYESSISNVSWLLGTINFDSHKCDSKVFQMYFALNSICLNKRTLNIL